MIEQRLRDQLDGRIIAPDDPEYDRARSIWNGMIDRRPRLILRCASAADVSLAVRYATETGTPVTVRGGGHNVAGLAVADDALMIDLSLMRSVRVDPRGRVAEVAGGATLLDVDSATTPFDLACPLGVVSETGVAGLTLGGGYGWLARRWGLTCDHLVGAEVVLADGSVVTASEGEHADLLWGLRGGGGNFGVVTTFRLRLRPVGGGAVVREARMPASSGSLMAYHEGAQEQPRELHTAITLGIGDAGDPVMSVRTVWVGEASHEPDATAGVFAALGGGVPPARTMSHLQLQTMLDGGEPWGRRYFTKSCYLTDLSGPTVEALVECARSCPSSMSTVDLAYGRGAIGDASTDSSAFPGRGAAYLCSASAAWTDPAHDEANVGWARRTMEGLRHDHDVGGYVNYQEHDQPSAVAQLYGSDLYQRLRELKERYDPANLFRATQNVEPAAG